MAHGEMRSTMLTSLEDAKQKLGFCLAWLIPAGQGQESHVDEQRRAEDIMGESAENKSKLIANVACATQLPSLAVVSTLMANVQGYTKAYVHVEPGENGSFLHWAARSILTVITSLGFRRQYAKSIRNQPQIPYVIYGTMERVFVALANFSKKPMNVCMAHSEQWHLVDTSSLVRATKTFTDDLRRLRDFIDGDVLAPNELYLNSPDKKALDDRDHRMRVAERSEQP